MQYILDSVVDALDENPSRKFIYAEQAFMWRWWRMQVKECCASQAVVGTELSVLDQEACSGVDPRDKGYKLPEFRLP